MRLRRISICLALLLACVVPAPASAATRPDPQPHIVGGTTATIQDAPWQVGLLAASSPSDFYAQFCGGSILSATWVVTAAHCVVRDGTVISPGQLMILAGKATLGLDAASSGPRTGVARIVAHPSYNPDTTQNDVALVELSQPLTLDGATRAAISLPAAEGNWPAAGTPALITGWGSLSFGGLYPLQLRKATVDVVTDPSDPVCGGYGASYSNASMLCGGLMAGGKDTCQGDSGGPFAIDVGGFWVIAGITSWGDGCATAGYPGIYTRVTSYVSWIRQETGLPLVPYPPRAVTAAVSGAGAITVSWSPPLANGATVTGYLVEVSPGGRTCLTARATTTCTLRSLRAGTAYTFSVSARSAAGLGPSGSSSPVTAQSVPGAVTSLRATPGDGQATVTFLPPSSDGGAAITGYEVSVDGGAWSPYAGSPVTVTGLANGTLVALRVRAVNAHGAGRALAATVTPAGLPGAPANLRLQRMAGTKVKVMFDAAAPNGAPVTRNTVTASPGGRSCVSSNTYCTVTELPPGTYTFTVRSSNRVGQGPASDASAQITLP